MARAAGAAPLVLYDPSAPVATMPGADLKSTTTTLAPAGQPCGLTAPCTDLNTASQAAPLGGSFEYGMSGFATAGVSNHGQGGSLGVLGWLKADDNTTLYVGLSVGGSRWNGQRFTSVPLATPRP